MFGKILVVCVGNICRSPVAQFLLQQYLPGKAVNSAGLAAVVDSDMDPTARSIALANGLDCPTHRARQLTTDMCREADLILVMEGRHREAVSAMSPHSRGKIFLLGNFLDGMEIPDPYNRSEEFFNRAHHQIAEAAKSWADKLSS